MSRPTKIGWSPSSGTTGTAGSSSSPSMRTTTRTTRKTASRGWSSAPKPKASTSRTSVTRRRRSRRLTGPPIPTTSLASPGTTAPSPQLVAHAFTLPVHLAPPPHDVSRLFVVEQDGAIKLIKSGKTLARPFLDIRERVRSGGERGLLSIAFHPDYASNRRFFVYYTEATGDLVIAEFASAATDPDFADPGNERRLLVIPHRKYGNHNGGQLAFGPDRYLYIG